jgi:transposase
MQVVTQFIGVDVSSKTLDINAGAGTTHKAIDNVLPKIEKWLQSLAENSVIAMEVTSSYHFLLAEAAHQFGFVVYVINPRDLKHYALGVGRRAKNDRIDAEIIRRYAEREHEFLRPWQPSSPGQARINTLFNRRATLIKARQSMSMSCRGIDVDLQALQPAKDQLQALIDEMEALILETLKADEKAVLYFRLLKTIPGIGKLTAAYLANLFTRTEFTNHHQLVGFIGLDLSFSDSGKKVGKRRLSKRGPGEARRLLFNAARAAAQGGLKPMYEHYSAKMPHTPAIVAIMRKLLQLCFGVLKSQKPFSLELYKSPLMVVKA